MLDDPAGGTVHAKEKNPEKCHRDNHHPGRYKNFMPRRPGHLAHFDANFVQKSCATGGDIRPSRAKKPQASNDGPRLCVSSFFNFPTWVAIVRCSLHSSIDPARPAIGCRSGRGGGIRTPTLGFGDRWSTVEPTPLNFARPTSLPCDPCACGTYCKTSCVSIRSECFFRFLVVV